jgi:uncharacterized protein (TIGR03086 family)
MNLVFAAILANEAPPGRFDIADLELPRAYDSSAELLISRFGAPGTLDRDCGGPLGSASGAERLQIRLYDLLAHGWDLARSTGQPLNVQDELAESSLAFATRQLEGAVRDGRFGSPQPCPDDSGSLDRLAAFLGRDVAWGPPLAAADR